MPKNKGKGGKNRRRGINKNEADKRELIFKEDGQEYAQVVQILGNGRVKAHCYDGTVRLCHIRGKMRKKEWINVGDVVLVGLRDFQDSKADVIMKYQADEVERLKFFEEIPKTTESGVTGDDTEVAFVDWTEGKKETEGPEQDISSSSVQSSDSEEDQGFDDGTKLFD